MPSARTRNTGPRAFHSFQGSSAMAEEVYLAVDLGASSGRVLAGLLDGRRLRLEEIHRFENGAIAAAGGLYWDVLGLWSHIVHGLRAAGAKYGDRIKSVGVDTWGVDFALPGPRRRAAGESHSYRDPRAEGMLAAGACAACRAKRSSPRPACSSCRSTRFISCWP